jgi:hypothetical protein
MNSRPETLSVPEFSEYIGCKRTYAYQLKKEGRLVLSDDGKRVRVAESIARIAETRDPSKSGVAIRHANARGAQAMTGHAPTAGDDEETATEPSEEQDARQGGRSYDFQTAKAKREHWAAEREHASWRKEAGKLMEKTEVVASFADAGATLRSRLEAWMGTLPPQLVGRDENAIRATLAYQVERLLLDLADKFNRMAGEAENV